MLSIASRSARRVVRASGSSARVGSRKFATFSTDVPKDLKYAKSHEWIRVQGNVGTVGITAEASRQLGDIVFVEVPQAKAQVKAGKTLGAVESVKAASDIYAPVTGEVIEVNPELAANPAEINAGPYEKGWMVKIKLANPDELNSLLTPEQYLQHCKDTAH